MWVNLFENSVISFSLKSITDTLKKFRVNQDSYFSETSLYEDSYRVPKILRTIELGLNSSLDQKGYINKIEEVIYHGDHTRVRINLLGNPEFILKVPNSSANLDIKLGNEIKIGWNSADARALDPK